MKKRFKLFRALGKTISLTWKMLDYWYVLLIYAGLLTGVSLIFRRWGYSCLTKQLPSWCYSFPDSLTGMVTYLSVYYICICAVIFAFGHDIYKASFKGEAFKIKDIFFIDKPKLKTIWMSFCSIFALIFPVVLAVYLINRPAVPVFEIELIFFIIVFSCALFCVLFIRLSSFIGYYMNDGKMPSLMEIFRRTSGKTYVPLVLFLTALLMMCVCQIRLMGALTDLNEQDLFSTTVLSEYIDYMAKLFFFALFLAIFRAQYELLKQEDEELAVTAELQNELMDADNASAEVEIVKEDVVEPRKAKTKKAATKKTSAKKSADKKKSTAKKSKK